MPHRFVQSSGRFLTSVVVLWGSAILGCAARTDEVAERGTASDKLRVVATTGMVADLVRQVAGEHAEVTALMSTGVDPHLYKPTTRDIGDIMNADLVFYSGLHLEGPMQETFERAAGRGRQVGAVTAGLPTDRILHGQRGDGPPDPHVWMDPGLWSQCLDTVAESLSRAIPEQAAAFTANAARHREELQKLDDYARTTIATIPEQSRVLVTAHDAFSYFSRAYAIPVRAVQGISTESEPGVEDVNSLVSFLLDRKIPVLFVESSVNDRNLTAVREGVSQRGGRVGIGGRLFSDAMGAAGSYEGTYVGMIDHNVTAIVRGLGGQAPERGFQGRLSSSH